MEGVQRGGCKLLRSGTNEQEWNGVGIVLSKELKEDLISVSGNSIPVMTIELGLEEMVVNIMVWYGIFILQRQYKVISKEKIVS